MRKSAVAFILALSMAYPLMALGQQPPAPAKGAYAPGLGEFMMQTQVRHHKLWLAGSAGNWDLADYEIDELKEGLEDVTKLLPVYKDMPVGQMIDSIMMAPIGEVEAAVKARDRNKFSSAFDKLTAACNNCHNASNRGFIVIQRPSGMQYPNQAFAPKPK